MSTRRPLSVCIPLGPGAAVEFRRYDRRTPILTLRPSLAVLVTLTLPKHLEAGHVEFASQLACLVARYAVEVERSWQGLPALPVRGTDAA